MELNTDGPRSPAPQSSNVSELILLWWVNRELDGAMIDLGAAISGGMKRT